MIYTTFLSAIAVVTYIHGASAAPQLTTALPLGVGTGGNGVISGVIVGSGPDGTTFVLTPAATGSATPETVTLVENASGLTAHFAVASGGVTQTQTIGCGISGDMAQCTQAVVGVNSASQTGSAFATFSGPIALATVVVSTASPSNSASASASGSASDSAASATDSPRPSAAGRRACVSALLGALTAIPILVAML